MAGCGWVGKLEMEEMVEIEGGGVVVVRDVVRDMVRDVIRDVEKGWWY